MNVFGIADFKGISAASNKIELYEFLRERMRNLSKTLKIIVADNIRFKHSTDVHEVVGSRASNLYSTILATTKSNRAAILQVEEWFKVRHEYYSMKYSVINHLFSLYSDLGNPVCWVDAGIYTLYLKSTTDMVSF
ncbi:hypothetical protein RF11_09334 [Thelohanellus kitauei]|uniref:Uncharacterized protein n=1 Tax=Thelohanellus kitauei TaxID=669202 RepID=A0A0C2J5L6_THEKT|nr:hypothetical protein RF11_09334 [Thelohanellus kitauei]